MPNYLDSEAATEALDTAGRVLEAINADKFARKALSDLYKSWKEMIGLALISVGKYHVAREDYYGESHVMCGNLGYHNVLKQ